MKFIKNILAWVIIAPAFLAMFFIIGFGLLSLGMNLMFDWAIDKIDPEWKA